jgi:transcriptional regulator with XRE-family HTH domain
MPNENLKNALRQAGLTVEQFAEIINVDPKTVQRWTGGRTPYPRHRATIALALDTPEHELWPEAVPPPADAVAAPDRPAAGDVTGSWGHASDPAAPDPVELLAATVEHVEALDDYGMLLGTAGMLAALRDRAFDGCDIRMLTAARPQDLQALVGLDGIELRVGATRSALSLLRAGETMLVMVPPRAPDGPMLLRLERRSEPGMFERLAHHFEALWDEAEVVSDPRQLDPSRLQVDGVDARPAPLREPPSDSGERPSPGAAAAEPARRRWPGRRD